MTARDLLQRRNTNSNGDTIWENSQLVNAAIFGKVAILDGIDVLSHGTISSLQRLVSEREIPLPNGTSLVGAKRYDLLRKRNNWSDADMQMRGLCSIHPSFRIIGIAKPGNTSKKSNWLNSETLAMFLFVTVRPLGVSEEELILKSLFPKLKIDIIKLIINFANAIRNSDSETIKQLSDNFSVRQMIRICRRLSHYPQDSIFNVILKTMLFKFLPSLVKQAMVDLLKQHGIIEAPTKTDDLVHEIINDVRGKPVTLKIGSVEGKISQTSNPVLIPNILFYDNPRQTLIIQEMLKDYNLGEHLLLVGNQGVGKNKIVDRFLQLMRLSREYIQLHRDTTVYNLTSSPSIINGKLVYEDSALVKAVKEGYILVVDEADKAPTHVTSILKSLIEDGEMVLNDGRKIVSRDSANSTMDSNTIVIHKDFRVIALANRPGFPFLGNDFFNEVGDVFALHCVDNPPPESELRLLQNYGPNIPKETLSKLITAFTDLRKLVDDGMINYPYSTRELVNVVRHLELYPGEGISRALKNVFDFDLTDDVKDLIFETMSKNGLPTISESKFSINLGETIDIGNPMLLGKWHYSPKIAQSITPIERELVMRGTWAMDISKHWEDFEIYNERSMTFSELLKSFKGISSGFVVDFIVARDFHLYIISTDPVMLTIINPNLTQRRQIPLYEYIPSRRNLRLTISEIGLEKVMIHDSHEHSLLLLNFREQTISKTVVLNMDPMTESVALSKLFLDKYSVDCSSLKQLSFGLPFQIGLMDICRDNIVVRSTENALFELNLTSDSRLVVHRIEQSYQGNIHSSKILLDNYGTHWFNLSPPNLYCSYSKTTPFDYKEIFGWNRPESVVGYDSIVLGVLNQYVTVNISERDDHRLTGHIEVISKQDNLCRRIFLTRPDKKGKMCELTDGNILYSDSYGNMSVFQMDLTLLNEDMKKWASLTGALDTGELKIIIDGQHPDKQVLANSEDAQESVGMGVGKGKGSGSGEGEGDGNGEGVGGQGGQGNGSSGGPADMIPVEARKSDTVNPNTFELRKVGELPKEVSDAQKELHRLNLANHLKQINMGSKDMEVFMNYKDNVKKEIQELRAILETIEVKNKERVWLKNKTGGDIDDAKLYICSYFRVDSIAGDRAIYKIRGIDDDNTFQHKPKQIIIVFDLSASMMRFNGHDGRMDRSLECALMIMEAFKGFEHKFNYKFYGHSGDGPDLELIPDKIYPKNEKDIFEILSRMKTHANYCMSGDNTVSAITTGIKNVVKEEGDDYFVLVLSDANLHQYNIDPAAIASGNQFNPIPYSLSLLDGSSLGSDFEGFLKVYEGVENAMDLVVNDSKRRVQEIKSSLDQGKELLECKRFDLLHLWVKSMQYKEMSRILEAINDVQTSQNKLESLIQEKMYIDAVKVVRSMEKTVNSPDLTEIGALENIREKLAQSKQLLQETLTKELQNHIYLKSKAYSFRIDKARPNSDTLNFDFEMRKSTETLHFKKGIFQEDFEEGTEFDIDCYSQMQSILECLFHLGKFEKVLEHLKEYLLIDLFHVVDRVISEIDQLQPQNSERDLNSEYLHFDALPDHVLFNLFLSTLYQNFQAKSGTEYDHYTKREISVAIQNELRALLYDYLSGSSHSETTFSPVLAISDMLRDTKKRNERQTKNIKKIYSDTMPSSFSSVQVKKDNTAEKFANVLDSGHKLIVPSSPSNILIAYKPTMEFIRNMEFTVGSRLGNFNLFLDDFIFNVYLVRVQEQILVYYHSHINGIDAFQADKRNDAPYPLLKSALNMGLAMHGICQTLKNMPVRAKEVVNFMESLLLKYSEKCNNYFKSNLSNDVLQDQINNEQDQEISVISVQWSLNDELVKLNRTVSQKETAMELKLKGERSFHRSELLLEPRKIQAFANLLYGLEWMIDQLKFLRSPSTKKDMTEIFAVEKKELIRAFSNISDDSLVEVIAEEEYTFELPLTGKMELQFDKITDEYHAFINHLLFSIRIEVRCHVIYYLDLAMREGNYCLEEEYFEPDPYIGLLNTDLTTIEEMIVEALPMRKASFTALYEKDLSKVRNYFQLLALSGQELLLFVETNVGMFTYEEYQVILELIYCDANGRDPKELSEIKAKLKEYFVSHRN
ncbi:von Willebrand factor A domain-containing protein 8 [Terramyces sp. JEL0728]|nr:von Willebrand factor A domain-containing protein 8 [Terramyces sp. JEL0728]